MGETDIRLQITRDGATVFDGSTSTARMKRGLAELADWLCRELAFPHGVMLLTGAGVVPPDDFTLQPGDRVLIDVADLRLENPVES